MTLTISETATGYVVKDQNDKMIVKLMETPQFPKRTLKDMVETITKKYDTVQCYSDGSAINVVDRTTKLIAFYWDKNDDWKYGIRTKEDAIELAEEFIRLYKMDHLPLLTTNYVKIEYLAPFYHVINNHKRVAKFRNEKDAKEYKESFDGGAVIDSIGLISHSGKWVNSIYKCDKSINIERYCRLLMDYMDKKRDCK